jgi:outer membrane protein assembly factor BamB
MRRSSTTARPVWRNQRSGFIGGKQWSLAAMMTSMIAGVACASGLLTAFAASVSAAEIGCLIALPDAPFVIPRMVMNVRQKPTNVTTQLYNNARQGANLTETSLNPVNVPCHFGKLHWQQVKGQILAQPLYVHDVDIDGIGRRSLVIVATAANIVYALDANDLSMVFQKQLGPDVTLIDPLKNNSISTVCAETYPPYIGVMSTPVIDVDTGTVFVESFNPVTVQQELHALNLHDRFTSDKKVIIFPNGEPSDWPMRHRNRAGLLLSKGIVYVAFSSFICDHPLPYAGWVIGYSAHDLTQVARWETPEPGDKGSSGIWQSGRGLVASDDGDIYLMTGNDSNFTELNKNPPAERLANSFLRLRPSLSCKDNSDCGLVLTNSFSPKNSRQLSAGDTDLGSSGPILLPGNILVGGGKQGRVYVIDTSTMQSLQDHTQPGDDGFEGFQAFYNLYPSKIANAAWATVMHDEI